MGQVIHLTPASRPTDEDEVHRVPTADVERCLQEALPGKTADLARALGRAHNDATVRRRLRDLQGKGIARREGDIWHLVAGGRPATSPVQADKPPEDRDDAELLDQYDMPEGFGFPLHFDREAREQLCVKFREHFGTQPKPPQSADLELLESYVDALQRARHANAAVTADGAFFFSKGRTYAHPGVAMAQTANRDAQTYRDALRKLDPNHANPDDSLQLF